MKLRIERYDQTEYQKVLCRRQAGHSRPDFSVEKATSRTARIVNPVFQPESCCGLLVRDPIFQRGGVGLDGLRESRGAAIAVPIHFRADGEAEVAGRWPSAPAIETKSKAPSCRPRTRSFQSRQGGERGQPERGHYLFWTDYIFAGGKRIAKADLFDTRLHVSATTCTGCTGAGFWSPRSGNSGDLLLPAECGRIRPEQFPC